MLVYFPAVPGREMEWLAMKPLRKCFCEYPREDLLQACREKFGRGRTTLDLMSACASAGERECVGAAALLGIEEALFCDLFADDPGSLLHALSCRRKLLEDLAREGILPAPACEAAAGK